MNDDFPLQDGIHACLNAMHRVLADATEATNEACGHMARREQNMAIGTVLPAEQLLEQATALYKALIALHRLKTVGGHHELIQR